MRNHVRVPEAVKRDLPVLLAILAVAASAAVCQGQLVPVAKPLHTLRIEGYGVLPMQSGQPFCRINNRLSGGQTVYGSGTLIDVQGGKGLVLSCSHIFTDGVGSITVTFPGGETRAGVPDSATTDRHGADLSVFQIEAPSVRPAKLGVFKASGNYYVTGFGSDGQLMTMGGRYLRNTYRPLGNQIIGTTVRQGDSGGGVINQSGELVGVVWGTSGAESHFTGGEVLDEFLRRVVTTRWQPSETLCIGGVQIRGPFGGGISIGGRQRNPSKPKRPPVLAPEPGYPPPIENPSAPPLDLSRIESQIADIRQRTESVASSMAGLQGRQDEIVGSLDALAARPGCDCEQELANIRAHFENQLDAVVSQHNQQLQQMHAQFEQRIANISGGDTSHLDQQIASLRADLDREQQREFAIRFTHNGEYIGESKGRNGATIEIDDLTKVRN